MGLEAYQLNDLLFVVAFVVLWAFGFSAGLKR